MTQQNNDPQDKDRQDTGSRERHLETTGESSAGSQAATTGYGTGEPGGQAVAPARQGENTPSNSGSTGAGSDEAARDGDVRTEQMSHADGSSEVDDPDT